MRGLINDLLDGRIETGTRSVAANAFCLYGFHPATRQPGDQRVVGEGLPASATGYTLVRSRPDEAQFPGVERDAANVARPGVGPKTLAVSRYRACSCG